MKRFLALSLVSLFSYVSFAGEPELTLPDLKNTYFSGIGISGWTLLLSGYSIILIGTVSGRSLPTNQCLAFRSLSMRPVKRT